MTNNEKLICQCFEDMAEFCMELDKREIKFCDIDSDKED